MKNVFGNRDSFKPFHYPWAYDTWLEHERMHWISREVPFHEDVRDWNNKLFAMYRDWETDRKSTRLNSSHRL